MIKITAKGLAKFMTAGDSQKRKILKDYKYPRPGGFVQAGFYSDTRDAVYTYLAGGRDLNRLVRRGKLLLAKAALSSGNDATKLRCNGLAIASFARNLSGLPFVATGRVRLGITSGSVRVSASPDVQAQQNGRNVLLRFEFSRQHLQQKVPTIMCQIMYDACVAQGLTIDPKDCVYIDVPSGTVHRKAKARARISNDISAAMSNLAAIWQTV